jgi:uncharacterized protein
MAMLLPVIAAPSIGSLAALWLWPGVTGALIYAVCKTVLYGIPIVSALRELSWDDVRQGIRQGSAGIWPALVGGGIVGLGAFVVWNFGGFDAVDASRIANVVRENGLDDGVKYWVFAAWLCIGNSGLEELVFRWFVDSRLRMLGLSSVAVVPISATLFTIHHIIVLAAFFSFPLVCLGSLGVFVGGAVWSWSLLRWRSLLPGWLMHCLVDVVILAVGAALLF